MFEGKLRIQWKTLVQLVRIITERLRRAQKMDSCDCVCRKANGSVLRRDIDGPKNPNKRAPEFPLMHSSTQLKHPRNSDDDSISGTRLRHHPREIRWSSQRLSATHRNETTSTPAIFDGFPAPWKLLSVEPETRLAARNI
jgi:hypothetical protein